MPSAISIEVINDAEGYFCVGGQMKGINLKQEEDQ